MVFNIQHYSIHDGPGIRTVVFLKGCPLRCIWCCNPESINSGPEIGFRQSFCNGCARCLPACRSGALSLIEGQNSIVIDRGLCDNCGACATACERSALVVYGQWMTVQQVLDEVAKDAPFYRRSGGGITVAGGEPLRQWRFLSAILEGSKRLGFHTAVETSGYGMLRVLGGLMDKIDLFLFDLKLMDSEGHRTITGKGNRLILRNARQLSRAGVAVQPRMPLIPGVNDSETNIRAVAAFLHSLHWRSIELMPYHRFGMPKYTALGKQCTMGDTPSAKPEDAERVIELFSKLGVECRASI